MKLSCLLSYILVSVQLAQTVNNNKANVYFIEKQRFLLEILHHVHEPLLNRKWLILGQHLITDKTEYVLYNEEMRKFYESYTMGRLVPKDIFYSSQHPEHYEQTLGLYYYFYNTRDWSTLRQNICWARVHVNAGLFLHVLTLTLFKREDYRPLIMPKIYEILPEVYYHEVTVQKALNFNFANWFREQGNLSDIIEILPKEGRNGENWFEAMSEMHLLRLNVNSKAHTQVKYLTEDIGWLSYWYYINMGVAQSETNLQQVHEFWYCQLRQLLSRYKLELYGQQLEYRNLREINEPKATHLLTWQMQRFQDETLATRKWLKDKLKQLENRVHMALQTQHYVLANSTQIDLRLKDNWLLALQELFPFDYSQLLTINAERPQLIFEWHTALRSANFFYYIEKLLKLYDNFRSDFLKMKYKESNVYGELSFQGIDITPLITYMEPVDFDLSNLLHVKHFYYAEHFQWPFSLQARQWRLQQRPFSITFRVNSNRAQSIVLRLFLTTPTRGDQEPFYQLAQFVVSLKTGYTNITKFSNQFFGLIDDHITLTELYQYVKLAESDRYDFPFNITTPNCGFPRRLLLPRGGRHGKPLLMHLLVIATPYNESMNIIEETKYQLNCDFSNPWINPFVPQLDGLNTWQMHWQQVEIYHEENEDD